MRIARFYPKARDIDCAVKRDNVIGARADNIRANGRHDPHQQAEDMTAPTIKRNAAKKPLISGRRPDMTMPEGRIVLAQNAAAPRLSARNKIPGTVARRTDDCADSEVTIDIGGGKTITAVVTRDGADEAGATPGAQVLAIFKTSHVILASD